MSQGTKGVHASNYCDASCFKAVCFTANVTGDSYASHNSAWQGYELMKGKSTEPCLKIINKVINLVVCFVPYLQNYYNVGRLFFFKESEDLAFQVVFFLCFLFGCFKAAFSRWKHIHVQWCLQHLVCQNNCIIDLSTWQTIWSCLLKLTLTKSIHLMLWILSTVCIFSMFLWNNSVSLPNSYWRHA